MLHNKAVAQKDALISSMQRTPAQQAAYAERYDAHYNESLSDVVRNMQEEEKIARTPNGLSQVIDPVFLFPAPSATGLNAHFYAPAKYIGGKRVGTLAYNTMVLWCFTVVTLLALYFNVLRTIPRAAHRMLAFLQARLLAWRNKP